MSLTTLRFTEFQVQRLQCAGGHGRAAPYQITTYNSLEMGAFGEVMEFTVEAANSAIFEKRRFRVLKQLLAKFKD
jgi:hypothetical protein